MRPTQSWVFVPKVLFFSRAGASPRVWVSCTGVTFDAKSFIQPPTPACPPTPTPHTPSKPVDTSEPPNVQRGNILISQPGIMNIFQPLFVSPQSRRRHDVREAAPRLHVDYGRGRRLLGVPQLSSGGQALAQRKRNTFAMRNQEVEY